MTKKNTPHIVPDDYFRNFEDRLFTRIDSEDFPKDTGFTVPERYFEDVGKHLNLQDKPDEKVFFLNRYATVIGRIAAIFIVGIFIFNYFSPSHPADITTAAIDRYINEGNLKMDLYELAQFIDEDDVDWGDFGSAIINNKELENYLIEESSEHFWTSAYAGE